MDNNIISIYDPIFLENESAISFLNELNIFPDISMCTICNNRTNIRKKDIHRTHGFYYYCKVCNKKSSLVVGTLIFSFKKPLYVFLRVVYGFIANFDYLQMELISGISKQSYSTLRKAIIEKIKEKKDDIFEKVGGNGIIVQIDETAICRGRIIENPSSTIDNSSDIQWLIGGVENTVERRFFLEIVPNREASTILNVLRRHVYEDSIIASDGYPSYPSAVRDFGSIHIIVPHNQGFVNAEGFHTNLIENLWSHLKIEYRIRRGIQLNSMENFIYEFYFKKYIIKKRTSINISNAFKRLLNLIFN